MDLLAEAREELAHKSRMLIEQETAWKWAARAVAAYERFMQQSAPQPTDLDNPARYLLDASHYLEEASEHAALSDSTGALLRRVHEWVGERVPPGTI